MTELLYGKSPLREALRAKRRKFKRIFYLATGQSDASKEEILQWAHQQRVPIQEVRREWFENRISQGPSQGIAAEVSSLPLSDWKTWLGSLKDSNQAVVLALDHIQDPQNVGAILRSAEACGVVGVLTTEKNSCPLSPAVSKASAGALEHQPILRVKNLVRALEELKKDGFWVVGTDVGEAQDALGFDWPQKTILVLGGEGSGMRRLTKEKCDFLIHLPLAGKISSLNVAQTAAVCLYLKAKAAQDLG